MEFLQWLTDDNFIYLGYREYEIVGEGDDAVLRVVPDSGLGIMSDPGRSSYATGIHLSEMTEALRGRMLGGPLVVISKTNRETTIHRAARMDYIGVRRVSPEGKMIGELRMVGLFTSKIASESARLIPIVRRKLDAITRWEDLFAGSHDHKAVVALFDSFPKDELFTAPAQELRHVIMTLLAMADGREVRLFVLHDEARRSVFAIVALPPDHVSAGLRARLEHLLEVRFGGTSVGHHIETEFDPARFHFTIHVPEGELPDARSGCGGTGGGRGLAQLGRSPVRRAGRHPRLPRRARAGGSLFGALPGVLQERIQDLPGGVRRHPVRAAGQRSTRTPWRCRTSGTWPSR